MAQKDASKATSAPKKRNTSGLKPFPKGVSGNPGGKPKKLPVTDLIAGALNERCAADREGRTWAELLVLSLLRKALKGDLRAIAEILDRVEGKPRQRNEHTGLDGGPISFELPGTREEIERRIAELEQKAKGGGDARKR